MSKTSFLLKTGLLLGSYALSSMFYPMPLFAQQVYTQGRGQIRAKIIVDKAPNSDTPEYVSATSTLIVRARVAVKAPARSVRGHKVLRRRTPGGYAWHDFLFDQVRVVWKEKEVPNPGGKLWVRVYDAETPEVAFKITGEPDFVVGEEYLLCLTEVDNFAFTMGPDHWRVVNGNAGAFLLNRNQVKRKGPLFKNEAPRTLSSLLNSISVGLRNQSQRFGVRHWNAHQPKGVRF